MARWPLRLALPPLTWGSGLISINVVSPSLDYLIR